MQTLLHIALSASSSTVWTQFMLHQFVIIFARSFCKHYCCVLAVTAVVQLTHLMVLVGAGRS
jgi:hypothetical protein